jgi:hypothetical protein
MRRLPICPTLQPRDGPVHESTSWVEMLAAQWSNPSDALSVLLLLGPDIVQKAVPAQAGLFLLVESPMRQELSCLRLEVDPLMAWLQ